MGTSGWPVQRILQGAKVLVSRLGEVRLVFTLASLGYCLVNWIAIRGPSIPMFLGALVFGVVAALVAAWVSRWLSSSTST
jgi:mannitol-specific phosphotransferase system IIBC component